MSRVYTTTPVAYNPNSPISGTLQIGNLAVGTDSSIDYSQDYGRLKWWMSPDQNDSYVIATQIPAGNEPVPNRVTPISASVGFYKTVDLTDQSFINLVNWISRGAYGSSINDATTWLSNNGYWTSYVNTIVNTSHVFLPQDGLPWTNYGDDGEGHSYLSVGFSVENSANLPHAGWYFIDDNDTVCQLLDTPVWFSNGAPSPYPNGTGWICVVDRICTFQDNNTNITFFEHVPTSFTIDSSMLDGLASIGNSNYASANGTAGFTVAQAVSEIYDGVYGTLTSGYGDINMVYSIAGITGNSGYICNVVWGSGSTIKSGLAKVGYNYGSNQVYIQSVDPTNNNFLNNDNNDSNGTCLVGTFNFPATFTLLEPLDNKGGWC
jgi:hypothetical protein